MRPTLIALLASMLLGVAAGTVGGEPPGKPPDVPVVPADVEARFELRTLAAGTKVYLLRFKSNTGETWVSTSGKWKPILEDAPPPPGAYDVTLVGIELGYTAVRIERRSGATWTLRDGKWTAVEEPEGRPAK